MTRERNRLQANNDHLATEVDLAGSEILDLQVEAEAKVVQIRSELESRQQSHVDTVSELSRLRAIHSTTLDDLDREIAACASSDRAAEVARIELSDLQVSLQSSEETVDALGQRVRDIQEQHQAAEQDRKDLRLHYEDACRERDAARRQLSIVANIVGAPPLTRPEEEDPAAILRLLREESADTSKRPAPRYLTYENPLEAPSKNVDPLNLPDPVPPPRPSVPLETAMGSALLTTEQQRVALAISKLGGRGREWARTCGTSVETSFPTWEQWKQQLSRVFAPPNQAYRVRARFLATRQGKKELEDYIQELRTLIAGMTVDPFPEAVTVTVFMEGLRTGVARTEVFRTHPTTFEAAVNVALNAEFNFKSS
ncbi:unnamed protein product [Phytophthora fragariaefolia]|uniref:Unnamed protein product n=1 Tax=Phytophthora fragariaefolia TaxID=1490495 RepID=A0A9W6TJY3_9STRA|nr:unnamed protein product [Phytophthora fragariaefolia]